MLATQVERALRYKSQIDQVVAQVPQREAGSRLTEVAVQVDRWVEAIKDLAGRVDQFQQDALIRKDLEAVPKTIKALEVRLKKEPDPATQVELEQTLHLHGQQLAALEQLRSFAQRAEMQIENTLSSLGTVYSQLLAGQSAHHIAGYAHLSAGVADEVQRLQDQLEAWHEVKLRRG
jgi:hypothetical protein